MIVKIRNTTWKIKFVDEMDDILLNNQNFHTAGVTDNNLKTIFIANNIKGKFLKIVLTHELVHAFCFEYNLSLSLPEEEHLANFVANYGADIIHTANDLLLLYKNKGIH